MQPCPCAPGPVWPGHVHGAGCLSARAMDTGFPTAVRVLPLPRRSWLGFVVCVFGYGIALNPAILGWGLWCVCLGTGLALTPPILAGFCGVCVWVRVLGLCPAIRGSGLW